MLKYFTKNLERRKSRFIFALQTWGFPHLLINLTNLTLGVRKFPRLSDTILFAKGWCRKSKCVTYPQKKSLTFGQSPLMT